MRVDSVYVISLESSPVRREGFMSRARKAGVVAEWFPAYHGASLDFAAWQSKGYLADPVRRHMPGSLGTLLSHVGVWDRAREQNAGERILVFEDDALISVNFLRKLASIPEDSLPQDWDMLWLGWHALDADPVNTFWGRPRTNAKGGRNSGHFAYIIRCDAIPKLKDILLPFEGRNSKDVVLRKNFHRFGAYFLLKKIVRTPWLEFESVRRDLNHPSRLKRRWEQILKNLKKLSR